MDAVKRASSDAAAAAKTHEATLRRELKKASDAAARSLAELEEKIVASTRDGELALLKRTHAAEKFRVEA